MKNFVVEELCVECFESELALCNPAHYQALGPLICARRVGKFRSRHREEHLVGEGPR